MINETCPDCGDPIPTSAPQGLCSYCLLMAGLQQADPGQTVPLGEESNSDVAAGTTVAYFGDYQLISEIARGGMGVVYKARQVNLNRDVALKMILAGALANVADITRFRTEAEAAANLKHPNIVAIHEVGEHDGQHYFSMDYVEGRNLAQLSQGQPLAPDRAAAYVKQIAEAIHFAHQRGTIHRDLKPQNILIDEVDQVRITDFGLAKQLGSDCGVTRSGDVMGSPSYMPPEQAAGRNDQIGPAADVYALGAILYELISGRPPFIGESIADTLRQVELDLPADPTTLNKSCAIDLATIAMRCLEKQPAQRFHSAQQLAEELGRFLEREPIQSRPVSRLRRLGFWARSHPWVITTAASLVILGLLMLSYGLYSKTQFLEWQQANPGKRVPDSYHDALTEIGNATFLLCAWLLVAPMLFEEKAKGVSVLSKKHWMAIERPVHPLLRLAHGMLGLIGVGVAVMLAARVVNFYVWHGPIWEATGWANHLAVIGFMIFAGPSCVRQALRNQQLEVFGSDQRDLSDEQVDRVRQLLIEQGRFAALELYRELAPNLKMMHRWVHLEKLVEEVLEIHPELEEALRVPTHSEAMKDIEEVLEDNPDYMRSLRVMESLGRFRQFHLKHAAIIATTLIYGQFQPELESVHAAVAFYVGAVTILLLPGFSQALISFMKSARTLMASRELKQEDRDFLKTEDGRHVILMYAGMMLVLIPMGTYFLFLFAHGVLLEGIQTRILAVSFGIGLLASVCLQLLGRLMLRQSRQNQSNSTVDGTDSSRR